jgi:hypothetical protein
MSGPAVTLRMRRKDLVIMSPGQTYGSASGPPWPEAIMIAVPSLVRGLPAYLKAAVIIVALLTVRSLAMPRTTRKRRPLRQR